MNMRARNILVLMAGLMAATGCSQKKPVAPATQPAPPTAVAPPAQARPTPAEAPAQTQTQASPTQGTPPPEPQPAVEQPTPTEQPTPGAEKPEAAKTKAAKPHSNGKKGGKQTARNTTSKTVVKADGAEPAPAAGQISPSLSHAEVAHDQATTEQLLQSAEATVNGIKRQLSQDEQATVAQIRDYVNQSRQATKANDLTRAYNLAVKARLLSDDLAKRR